MHNRGRWLSMCRSRALHAHIVLCWWTMTSHRNWNWGSRRVGSEKNSLPPLNFALTQSKSILGHKRFIPMQVNLMAWNILRCQITFKFQTLVHVSKKFIVYENHVHQWWFCLVYFAWKVFLFQQLCWCCASHDKRVFF